MFLLIDNYDSFTFNLVQAFMELGRQPRVIRNDDPTLLALAQDPALSMVCISPGPGQPDAAGLCLEFLARLPKHIPVLGVCLGHQILARFAGLPVRTGNDVMHGKQSPISHDGKGLFSGLPSPIPVGRYHSLFAYADGTEKQIKVTARTEKGEIMAIQYTDRPWAGVQFHPESVLTPDGQHLLANFPSALTVSAEGKAANGAPILARRRSPRPMASIIESLAEGKNLNGDDAAEIFARLMDGELPASQAGALLLGLRAKGETPEEVGEAVDAILSRAVPVPPVEGVSIDIVGTGGDSKNSFNCSTATALTLAGMGYRVLKHGNRSVSSRCGSADVLEQLGIALDTSPEAVTQTLDKEGFVFLFAPRYHPAFRHVMPLRRELGVRTLFNILGPLVNPARPTHHMLGVPNKEQMPIMAATLARSPTNIGVIVRGARGYDELTTFGEASLIFVKNGQMHEGCLDPAAFGFTSCAEEDLAVEDAVHAAEILRQILRGEGPDAMQQMLALNVGVALYLLDQENLEEAIDETCGFNVDRMHQCMQRAKKAVAEGAGRRFSHA